MATTISSTSSSGSVALIDEISHQFLVCQICSESFKRPKTLKCLHTFCEECLEIRYAIEEQERPYRFLLSRSLSCPVCLAKTDLPPGGVRRLPNNAVLTQLDDVIRRRKLSAGAQSCDICSAATSSSRRTTSRATAKCLECSKMMCTKCVEIHRKTKVTKDHCLFDIQVEKDVECKVHREEVVRFYCEQCQSCVCVLCTFQDHAGHSIFSFAEGIDRYSHTVRSLLGQARSRSQRLTSQLTTLSRCEASLLSAEEAIRNAAMELVSGVRRRERELVGQLRCVYNEGSDGLVSQRELIADMLRNINATCDLADVLLQERSAEFLLVYREISDKLNSILQSPLKDLPDALVNRNIRFKASSKNVVESVGFLHVSNSTWNGSTWKNDSEDDDSTNPLQSSLPSPLPSSSLLHADECVDGHHSHDHTTAAAADVQTNLRCVCDRKPVQTSSSAADDFSSSSFDVSSSSSTSRSSELVPSPRSRPSLRPPSPRGPDGSLWPPPPLKLRRRNQQTTGRVEQWDSETETVALVTETKGTSTVSISTVDRSTLTTLRTTCDRTTTTDWLVMSRDQETFTSSPVLIHDSIQTDPPRLCSKSVQSHPETLNKLTMTRKPIQLERETNTPSVARFDCEVTARIVGDDKSTSTSTIATVDVAVGCSDDVDFECVDDNNIERNNFVVRHRNGNRRNFKRSVDLDLTSSSSSSSSSSPSLFVQMERRSNLGTTSVVRRRMRSNERSSNYVSTDDDDGYDSSMMKMTSSSSTVDGIDENNFDGCHHHHQRQPSDREMMELEKYRNHLEESSSSSSSTGCHCRDSSSSSSSSVPSISSSSLLSSSSSSRRVSPSSSSSLSFVSADDFSSAESSVQRCNQPIVVDQSSAETTSGSLPRLNPSDLHPLPLPHSSGFAEELSTLEENDDEDLESPMEPKKTIPPHQQQQQHPRNIKADHASAEESNNDDDDDAIVSGDEDDLVTRKKKMNTVQTNVGSDKRLENLGFEDGGLQVAEGIQLTTDGVVDASNNSQTKPDDRNDFELEDNASSRDRSDVSHHHHRVEDECEDDDDDEDDGGDGGDDGGNDSDDESQMEETPKVTAEDREKGDGGGDGMFNPPDITTDVFVKNQISHITETSVVDFPSKNKSEETTFGTLDGISTEELNDAVSVQKSSPAKLVPSLEAGLSPETSRRRSKNSEQTQRETTPSNGQKPDLISETLILSTNRKKTKNSSSASTLQPLHGMKMEEEDVYMQLERYLPELQSLATSLDCSSSSSSSSSSTSTTTSSSSTTTSSSSSSSSSHSSIVHLIINICSALIKESQLDFFALNETKNPLNNSSSQTIECNGPTSSRNPYLPPHLHPHPHPHPPLHHPPPPHRPTVLVDRAVSPLRTPLTTMDSQTSTSVPLVTQGSNTELALRVDIGVQSKHSSTCDRETSMLRSIVLDKETSTPHRHLLHKNTSTDNQMMVDNQTTMTSDVKAAYLEATARQTLTFTRGTCTPRRPTASDRASSPVRFSCVDKAVLATKGEALEPMDLFPGVGKTKNARKPFVSSTMSRKAKLECISEGTIDEETEDSEESDAASVGPSSLSNFRLKMIQRLTSVSFQDRRTLPSKSFAKRNSNNNKSSLLPLSPRPIKSFESTTAFSFDGDDVVVVVEKSKKQEFSEEEEEEEMMEEEELEDTVEIS